MKKQIMILGLALLTLGVVSCKKDYVCDCHIDYQGGHEAGDHADIEFEYESVKKSDAEDMCDAQQALFNADPEVAKVNCELK
jgi:hypothetical protein